MEEKIKAKLKNIIDPDLSQDIVSLGFVKGISWEKKTKGIEVKLTLELTTPACPVKEIFKQDAERLIKEIDGVESVEVTLSSVKKNHNQDSSLKTVKNIIAIASGKGGVGKSTVAAMMACEVASRGYKVGLLDIDIFGPSLPTLFGIFLDGLATKDKKIIPYEKSISTSVGDNGSAILKLVSFGFLLGDSPAIMRGPMVSNYIQQLLHQVDWGDLDYLFIDLPPGTGDTQLTLSQTVNLDGAVIITTGQSLSLVDVSKGILMFEKVNVPILGLVENMSYFDCGNCHQKHYPFRSGKSRKNEKNLGRLEIGEGGIENLKARFGIPQIAEIPFLSPNEISFKDYHSQPFIKEMIDSLMKELGKQTYSKPEKPQIEWNDKVLSLTLKKKQFKVTHHDLRFNCLCALCVDEITGEHYLTSKDIREDILPLQVEALGNYALSIQWNDGHNSGIYPYRLIEKLQQKTNDKA